MLKLRLISGFVLSSLVVLFLWLDSSHPFLGIPGFWLIIPVMFFALGTATEIIRLVAKAGININPITSVFASALPILSAYLPNLNSPNYQTGQSYCLLSTTTCMVCGIGLSIGLILFFQILDYGRKTHGESIRTVVFSTFVALYVGTPFATLILIRGLGDESWGLFALLTTVFSVKAGDVGAYLIGNLVGQVKLSPNVSPGKTYEGAIGGVIFSIMCSFICFHWLTPKPSLYPDLPLWVPILFGIVCSVFGILGDLSESLIKRELDVKDSGFLFPGMGGVWDVTDSIMGAATPAYLVLISAQDFCRPA